MRVLHVIPAIAPRYGGPSVAAVEMCRALIARGHQIAMATTDADGPDRLDVALEASTEYRGVPTWFFPVWPGESLKVSPPLARWLRPAVSGFDLVHIHAVFSHASLAAGRACREAGVPYVVRPLGTLDPWSVAQKPWRKQVFLRAGGFRLLRGAAAIHYTTAAERDQAAALVASRAPAWVIPLGVPDNLFDLPAIGYERRERLVVAITRLHHKKNLDALIEAFLAAGFGDGLPGWQLIIAGTGDDKLRRRLETLARLGAGTIHLVGWVDAAARQALLDRARLFALPSSQENFGLSVLEAMAAGVPVVIGAGVNLAAEVSAAGAGWVIEADGALGGVLRDAMLDADGQVRRGVAARRLAGRYRWSAVAAQLDDAYRGIQDGLRTCAASPA
jgi:glycosyltransferase involved in cell wall biosynthesis